MNNIANLILKIASVLIAFCCVCLIWVENDKFVLYFVEVKKGFWNCGNWVDSANFILNVLYNILLGAVSLILFFVIVLVENFVVHIIVILFGGLFLLKLAKAYEIFEYTEGTVFETKFFIYKRLITEKDRSSWLNEKIYSYNPVTKYEPSKEWVKEKAKTLEFDTFDELKFKFENLISNYIIDNKKTIDNETFLKNQHELKMKSLEVQSLKLKGVPVEENSLSTKLENFVSWFYDHPKITFTIIIIGVGFYWWSSRTQYVSTDMFKKMLMTINFCLRSNKMQHLI